MLRGQWVCHTCTASTSITEVLHIAYIYIYIYIYNVYTTVEAFPLQNIHLIQYYPFTEVTPINNITGKCHRKKLDNSRDFNYKI